MKIGCVKAFLILCLIISLFIWGMAHGTGHNIPVETNLIYGSISLISVLMLVFLSWKKY